MDTAIIKKRPRPPSCSHSSFARTNFSFLGPPESRNNVSGRMGTPFPDRTRWEVLLIELRPVIEADLYFLWHWIHEATNPEWTLWDAPYFKKPKKKSIQDFMAEDAEWFRDTDRRMVFVDGKPAGIVTRYEENPAGSGWWEVGIILYDPDRWGQGIGREALEMWVSMIFEKTDAHLVTLTTWSGNERMMRAAARIGFTECARIPEARVWNGRRWDSIRMAFLRRAWERQLRPAPARLSRGKVPSHRAAKH